MSSLDLSENQTENIEKLKLTNSLTVTTGQQVGFLGGPIYTLLKIFSTVSLAEELNEKYPDLNFVPVFWLEDNDHDSHEASHIYCPDKSNNIQRFSCVSSSATTDKTMVSEKVFVDTISESIENVLSSLNETEFTSDVRDLLYKYYKTGNRWNDAFLGFLNEIAGETGILFIKASEIIKSGICKPLILKEITAKGATDTIILEANDLLTANGYHIQAKHSPVNLFYHADNIRQKIVPNDKFSSFKIGTDTVTYEELMKSAEEKPDKFSPNVLLRPVFQDYALPNSAYIGGPSEIGYISQTKELFDHFNVQMASYLSRHSATIIDRKSVRILEQNSVEPEYFLTPFSYIEYDLLNSLKDLDLEEKVEEQKSIIHIAFEEIARLALTADPTLAQSVKSAEAKSEQLTESIVKKLDSALKRNNEVTLSRYKYCSTMLFPMDTLQERIFTPLFFINQYGKSAFIDTIKKICNQNRDHHLFVNI
jgi:bacillithiol biosynthesis cysteine-adding enzyme BshC